MDKQPHILKYGFSGYVITLLIGFLVLLMFFEVPSNNKDLIMHIGSMAIPAITAFLGYNKGRKDQKDIDSE